MKKLLLLLVMLPFIAFGQDSPYKYWQVENKAVYFDAVYEDPGKDTKQIKEELLSFIPTVKGVTDVQENSAGLTAKLEGYDCDYKAMGYNRMNAPIYILQKKSGNISVQVKDGKYRVVISNITCDKKNLTDPDYNRVFSNTEIETVILKLNKTGWATAKGKIKTNKQLEEDFHNSFQIKQSSGW
jgi:hypothetical protein